MHALCIPTTRALCMTGSEEEVYRERIEKGAMLLRMTPSHLRFGSFEVFYYRSQFEGFRGQFQEEFRGQVQQSNIVLMLELTPFTPWGSLSI